MMNTKRILSNVSMIAILVSLFACDPSSDDFTDISKSEDILTKNGSWMISWFWDKDKDETSDFTGYTFNFMENGELHAMKNGNIVHTGQWSHDSSSSKLIIQMASTKPLEELTDDWIIKTMNDDKIELKDDNEEHLEELHFVKK